jgi:hypothetical protein
MIKTGADDSGREAFFLFSLVFLLETKDNMPVSQKTFIPSHGGYC